MHHDAGVKIGLEHSMGKDTLVLTNDISKHKILEKTISCSNGKLLVRAYSDLAFSLDGKKSKVILFSDDKVDVQNFSKILVLATPEHSKNHIFSALACYCHKYNIPMFDDYFTNTSGKLYSLWRFWENDIPTAKTFFGPKRFLLDRLDKLGNRGILKSTHSARGKDNFLVRSRQDLESILNSNPDTSFILQNFIPNDGDYRIIVVNFEPKLAIFRSSHGKDHRNNTSAGGEAKILPLEDVDPGVIKLAVDASKALNIKIAGADIIRDKDTGEYTVLEVNRTPQLVTGAFIEEKMDVLKYLIRS